MANDEQPAPAPPPAEPQTPVDYSAAWLEWWFHMSRTPARQAELAQLAAAKTADTLDYMTRAMTGQAQEPPSSDPRFADPAWRQFPFNVYVRAFENGAEFLRAAMKVEPRGGADLLPFAPRPGPKRDE